MNWQTDDEAPPPPPSVSAYLQATGWEPVDATGSWARFRTSIEGEEVFLEVPLLGHAPDYPLRISQLVDDLRRIERRAPELVLRDIRSSANDVLKIRLGAPEMGRISVEQGARAFQRTRDLLLAAACAAIEKRPVYSRRKFDRALEYLARTRFGPTELGSFVLTVESVVPPQIGVQTGLPGMEPEPFDRAVYLTLAYALAAARRIVDQVSVTRSLDPIVNGVAVGVSSNLCDALAGLIDAGFSQSLELRFRWASSRPPGAGAPREIVFENSTSPFLGEMARTLRETSTFTDFELVGPIHKLSSTAPEAGGEITVAMAEPLPGRKVRINLRGPEYQQAAVAHSSDLWISCDGDLVRQGAAFVLLDPRNFRVLRDR
jgi:hypothetical protein